MKTVCRRLHRGDDLLLSIRTLCEREKIDAAVVLSAVGCVSRAVLRDAGGVNLRSVDEPCEIVSLNGTAGRMRCHLHLVLSREDLSVIGGHMMPGCIVNTTCELVLGVLEHMRFDVEQDAQTGYDELIFTELKP